MEKSPQNNEENKSGQSVQPQSEQTEIAETLEQQRQMVKELASQNGGIRWFRSAERVLDEGTLLTKDLFLTLAGIDLDLEYVMENLDELIDDETLPDYFPRLPD